MRRRKQFSEWLATYNVGGVRRVDAICRVRLTALKLKAPKRPHISLNILAHPPVEACLIDALTLLDRHNTRVFLVPFYALRHGAARWAMRSARSRICATRGPQSPDCGLHLGHPRCATPGRERTPSPDPHHPRCRPLP